MIGETFVPYGYCSCHLPVLCLANDQILFYIDRMLFYYKIIFYCV
jgi:hypothetical protein